MKKTRERLTDPYGNLEYVVGSGDDFICLDFHVKGTRVLMHAVVNSETGSFIEDYFKPYWVPAERATDAAARIVWAALDWCADNHVRHTVKGWRQDPHYFTRAVAAAVAGSRKRVARMSGKVPDGLPAEGWKP